MQESVFVYVWVCAHVCVSIKMFVSLLCAVCIILSHEITSILEKTVYKQTEKSKFVILSCSRYLARVIYKLRLNSWNTKYSQNVTCVCKNILSVKHILLEWPITTEVFQKNGYNLNACHNVRYILHNTDVINHIVKLIDCNCLHVSGHIPFSYGCVCVHMSVHDLFSYGCVWVHMCLCAYVCAWFIQLWLCVCVCVCVVSFGYQECQHVCSVIWLLCVSVLHTNAAGLPACS